MPISQMKGYFENPCYHFLEEPMHFLVVLKLNPLEKEFSCVKTKANLNFPLKLGEKSNHSFSSYLIDHFFKPL